MPASCFASCSICCAGQRGRRAAADGVSASHCFLGASLSQLGREVVIVHAAVVRESSRPPSHLLHLCHLAALLLLLPQHFARLEELVGVDYRGVVGVDEGRYVPGRVCGRWESGL